MNKIHVVSPEEKEVIMEKINTKKNKDKGFPCGQGACMDVDTK